MLELKKITKVYETGTQRVEALKGVDIKFRKNEFVSILGPSGCGKTTMLNIVGGLDRYTSGDLKIRGKSTKEYKDKDWDTYRNHSVGFIFQSYNLIPHQTVVENVELALTLSGVSRAERRQRAVQVLEKVGLSDKIKNRPNQLSGGQMQRVAIARALINDPEILLADEPTGALDTKTSIQIMELLEEIAKDRLIIMVTHNPELAEKHSTRIIKLLDGHLLEDSNAPDDEEWAEEERIAREHINAAAEEQKAGDKKNLTTEENEPKVKEQSGEEKNGVPKAKTDAKPIKKKRTSMSFLTALSLSFNNLLTKKARTIMVAIAGSIGIIGIALILSLSNGFQIYIDGVQKDTLSSYPITIQSEAIDMGAMFEALTTTNNPEINHELDKIYSNDQMIELFKSVMSKTHQNDLKTFKKYLEDNKTMFDEYASAIQYGYDLDMNIYSTDVTWANKPYKTNPNTLFEDLLGNMSGMFGNFTIDAWSEMLDNDKLLDEQYDLVEGKWPVEATDIVVVLDKNNEIDDYMMYGLGLKNPEELEDMFKALEKGEDYTITRTELSYSEVLGRKYRLVLNTDYYKKVSGAWVQKTETEMESFIRDSATVLNIVGIIKPSPEATNTSISGAIGYTSKLTKLYIDRINDATIVNEQKDNPDNDVFTGYPFERQELTLTMIEAYANALAPGLEKDQILMALQMMKGQGMSDTEIVAAFVQMMKGQGMSDEQILNMFYTAATYESNLKKLGSVEYDTPSVIYIYAKDFNSKDKIAEIIKDYNKEQTDAGKSQNIIKYTDFVAIMMKSISTVVNAITYVLIAFVAISLVVSSIMIGIITYISVLERIKEIGILRSVGASKRDISRVFNAEAVIIGFAAGLLGIIVTLLLTIPANIIIKALTGIAGVANLPVIGALVLIAISVLLTFIAGLIPSRIAAKKDPVEALRTE